MLIGLVGQARSGKGTCAKILVDEHGFIMTAFADPLKRMLVIAGLCTIEELWGEKTVRSRELLQKIGTGIFRKQFGTDFWLNKMQQHLDCGTDIGVEHTVVEDIRFPDEAQLIRDNGGVLIRVEREGNTHDVADYTHVSESHVTTIPCDHYITAPDGDVVTLVRRAQFVFNEIFDKDLRERCLIAEHNKAVHTMEKETAQEEMIEGYIARDEKGDLNFHLVLPVYMAGGMELFSYWRSDKATALPERWFPKLTHGMSPMPFTITAIEALEGNSQCQQP